MRRLLLAAAVFAALATPALAGQAVTLRADTADADGVVTLGDLFDGAGAAGAVPVATRTSPNLVLNARAVQLAAARAGLDWANAQGLRTIVVHGAPAASSAAAAGAPVAAVARGNRDVLTYARSLSAGEVLQPTDLVWGKAAAAPADAPADPDLVIGLVAKRPLRQGAPVSARDVAGVQVIKPGEAVTVTFDQDGVTLALQGKATGGAAVGEMLNIQNTASKKIIQAIVTGPGQAVVGPAADSLKADRSTRYALR
jgi:flagella basal body P-ring formation protein FlgA